MTRMDRGQGVVRALFVVLGVFFFLFIAVNLVLAPALDTIIPIILGRSAVTNAPFINATSYFDRLRLIGYIGVPVTIIGLVIGWVVIWFVRRPSGVRGR